MTQLNNSPIYHLSVVIMAATSKSSKGGEAADLDGIGADLAPAVLGNARADVSLSPYGQEVAAQLPDVLSKSQHPLCQLCILSGQPLVLRAQIARLHAAHSPFVLHPSPAFPHAHSSDPITNSINMSLFTLCRDWPYSLLHRRHGRQSYSNAPLGQQAGTHSCLAKFPASASTSIQKSAIFGHIVSPQGADWR